jgi:2-polyprenyl-3-methyl-5-hydroxy-6-metoxy-1,4-benzoquinol methylase
LPEIIQKNAAELKAFGAEFILYVDDVPDIVLRSEESRINSKFFIDHSRLPVMLGTAQTEDNPWRLGELPEGWEWFAFTFRDQPQISLAQRELDEMLRASDEVTRVAYARMLLESPEQKWTAHYGEEVDFIVEQFASIDPKNILDFGCGMGRHSLELAARGFAVTGVDYVPAFIERASARAAELGLRDAKFISGDCKTIALNERFDAAICLYDVIGSYANDLQNQAILGNLADHVKPGGLLLISVMNMELTERKATNWFTLDKEPDKLLTLKPSSTMEKTGNVFNPDYYMIERFSKLVYRKEQFRSGPGLPEEFIVRDRRYSAEEIQSECKRVGLDIVWARYVRAGRWAEDLSSDSDNAKEVLVLCRKPNVPDWQGNLF